MKNYEYPKTLDDIFNNGYIYDLDNNKRTIDDGISQKEANVLKNILLENDISTTLEIGVAHGVSTLVFCSVLKFLNKSNSLHYGIDPNQFSDYGGAAINALKKENLEDYFKLLEGPSHLMLPELIKNNVVIDCALIDGWHTFDYTLIDFFLIDKILKQGGIILFHDMYMRSKQKVIKFIKSHRDYKIMDHYNKQLEEYNLKTLKFFMWRIWKTPALFFSKYHWLYQTKSSHGLFIIQKKSNYEPPFNFYKSF